MDHIYINNLALECIIGTLPHERIARQPVVITLDLELDLKPAGASDALEDTVDYSGLVATVSETVCHSQCKLLERLAQLIADKCLSYRLVNSVRVTIEKPAALPGAKASISIHRIKSHQE